jgi:hypothetical protein
MRQEQHTLTKQPRPDYPEHLKKMHITKSYAPWSTDKTLTRIKILVCGYNKRFLVAAFLLVEEVKL